MQDTKSTNVTAIIDTMRISSLKLNHKTCLQSYAYETYSQEIASQLMFR